jgi:hypothetical protein
MKIVRALLACLWVLFGVTATAHAGMALPASDPPCHDQAADHHQTPEPRSKPTLMPCCSQPVVVAPADVFLPSIVRVEYVHLTPTPVRKLTGVTPAYEPPPPKSL